MTTSRFIRAMHPKTDIKPDRADVAKVLKAGWWGQLKIHGHRAQIHVPSDPHADVEAYNREGQRHAKALPPSVVAEIRRLFQPRLGWTVIDCEWLKGSDRVFVFDLLRDGGELLEDHTYAERYERLPRVYSSAHVETLGLLKTLPSCLEALESPVLHVEGLVFRAPFIRGFIDSAIVRCRRRLGPT